MTLFQSLKMMDLLFIAKNVFSDKATFHPSELLTDMTLEFGAATTSVKSMKVKRDSTQYTVFCDPHKKMVRRVPSLFAKCTVTGVVLPTSFLH